VVVHLSLSTRKEPTEDENWKCEWEPDVHGIVVVVVVVEESRKAKEKSVEENV
jgi:hypothetical protein